MFSCFDGVGAFTPHPLVAPTLCSTGKLAAHVEVLQSAQFNREVRASWESSVLACECVQGFLCVRVCLVYGCTCASSLTLICPLIYVL